MTISMTGIGQSVVKSKMDIADLWEIRLKSCSEGLEYDLMSSGWVPFLIIMTATDVNS